MKTVDTIRLRAMLGWLGIMLPWISLILCVYFKCAGPNHIFPDSISITYHYAPTITPFVVILGSASILLVCYRGYCKVDDVINTITGIAGLGICVFPCANSTVGTIGTFQLNAMTSNLIHIVCAFAFFSLLSYNSIFIFTKSSGTKTYNKKIRNIIYVACGICMVVSIVCLVPIIRNGIYGGTWVVEAVALFFFGISYLTKADIYPWLFCDTPYVDDPLDNSRYACVTQLARGNCVVGSNPTTGTSCYGFSDKCISCF